VTSGHRFPNVRSKSRDIIHSIAGNLNLKNDRFRACTGKMFLLPYDSKIGQLDKTRTTFH